MPNGPSPPGTENPTQPLGVLQTSSPPPTGLNVAIVLLPFAFFLVFLGLLRGPLPLPALAVLIAFAVIIAAILPALYHRHPIQRVEVFPDRLVFLKRSGGTFVLPRQRIDAIRYRSHSFRYSFRAVDILYDGQNARLCGLIPYRKVSSVTLTDLLYDKADFDRFLSILQERFPDLYRPWGNPRRPAQPGSPA